MLALPEGDDVRLIDEVLDELRDLGMLVASGCDALTEML